jgi:hypothetical protein
LRKSSGGIRHRVFSWRRFLVEREKLGTPTAMRDGGRPVMKETYYYLLIVLSVAFLTKIGRAQSQWEAQPQVIELSSTSLPVHASR